MLIATECLLLIIKLITMPRRNSGLIISIESKYHQKMPQTELSLWSKLKYASVDIGLKSTIHAIPNILGHEKWSLKIVWMICFVTSAAICITLIFNDIFEYLEYDVVTTVTINYDAPAPFPQVNIFIFSVMSI